MGTDAHVLLRGAGSPAPETAVRRLEELERCWSRFRPDSELSSLAASGGRFAVVSSPTAQLLERSRWAWERTGGRFDPTVGASLVALGYDRSFEQIRPGSRPVPLPGPAPGCAGIDIDVASGLVRLPAGVSVDPGGIGKGLAADLVAVEAVEAGADAALVSVGGDLRAVGSVAPVGPPGWELEVDHHVAAPARLHLVEGALATSTTLRRRWSGPHGAAHHVIDPRTGRPLEGSAVACSVLAGEAWWAEALATAVLVGWDDMTDAELDDLLDGAGALVTLADGAQTTHGPLSGSFSTDREVA